MLQLQGAAAKCPEGLEEGGRLGHGAAAAGAHFQDMLLDPVIHAITRVTPYVGLLRNELAGLTARAPTNAQPQKQHQSAWLHTLLDHKVK
jgi:hypothetical protein